MKFFFMCFAYQEGQPIRVMALMHSLAQLELSRLVLKCALKWSKTVPGKIVPVISISEEKK